VIITSIAWPLPQNQHLTLSNKYLVNNIAIGPMKESVTKSDGGFSKVSVIDNLVYFRISLSTSITVSLKTLLFFKSCLHIHIIVGQSVGEVAAAYAAGCVTLSEAVKVTYFRTYLSAKSTGGRMLVVRHTDIGKLEELCESFGNTLNIAVYSSNETCVVSGDAMAVKQLQKKLSSNPNFPSVLLT
jgi:acyl transferase domain-containing protein